MDKKVGSGSLFPLAIKQRNAGYRFAPLDLRKERMKILYYLQLKK